MSHRILHLISSLHVGGAGRLLVTNAAGIQRHGFESHVAYLTPRADLVPELQAWGLDPVGLDHKRRLDGPRTVARLVRLIRQHRIDLVHTHLLLDRVLGGLAAALCRRPVITTLHTGGEGQRLRGRHRFEDWVGRLQTRRFLAVSEAVAAFQIETRGLPAERIEVLHSGVSVERFDRELDPDRAVTLRRELGLGSADPVLVHVGRLAREKGQRYLIPMMRHVVERWPRTALLLVGEGDERREIDTRAQSLGLDRSVVLAGTRSDVPEILALADVFCFPSEPGEGLGLALLEAMAAGKPVVASDVPALAEVVADRRSGFLVPVGDSEALAAAVLDLLAHPDRGRAMGRAGRTIIEELFSAERAVARLVAIYRAVLETEV